MNKPDFENCIVNISATFAEFLGCENKNPTLPILKEELAKNYKNVVFIIFDGLGMHPIERNLGDNSFLRKNIKQTLTSVFPSTTTNATTSMLTNTFPLQHGWLGWSMYFEEAGIPIDIYLSKNSKTGESVPNLAEKNLPVKPYYLNAKTDYQISKVVPPYWKDGTDENYNIYHNIDEFFEKIDDLCQKEGKQFAYCYCEEPDHTMHMDGVTGEKSHNLIVKIDERMFALHKRHPNTLFVATADHGHIDIDGYIPLYQDATLLDCLEWEPTLEPRATAFKVKKGREEEFERLFNEKYGSDFELHPSRQLIDENYFGTKATKNAKYLGDYIAIAKTHKQFLFYEGSIKFKGHHTSLTEEITVPLIII